jgi:hypothetical protein
MNIPIYIIEHHTPAGTTLYPCFKNNLPGHTKRIENTTMFFYRSRAEQMANTMHRIHGGYWKVCDYSLVRKQEQRLEGDGIKRASMCPEPIEETFEDEEWDTPF